MSGYGKGAEGGNKPYQYNVGETPFNAGDSSGNANPDYAPYDTAVETEVSQGQAKPGAATEEYP